MQARTTWEHDHDTELQRLDALDHQIQWHERLDRVASRNLDRSVEHGVGIDMC
jgi:hypothetical protein